MNDSSARYPPSAWASRAPPRRAPRRAPRAISRAACSWSGCAARAPSGRSPARLAGAGVALARARFERPHRPALVDRRAREAPARAMVLGQQQRAAVALAQRALRRAARSPRRADPAAASGCVTATRLRPTRRPTSSRVSPSSSTSAAHARASSIGLRSSRAMFSISASSSASASSRARTIAGIALQAGDAAPHASALAGDQLVACRRPAGARARAAARRAPPATPRAPRAPPGRSAGAAGWGWARSARPPARAAPRRLRSPSAETDRIASDPGPCPASAQPRAATSFASSK